MLAERLLPLKALVRIACIEPVALFILYSILLFSNLFATFFLLARRFFLKHTGQKLVYVDKQLRIGQDDLSAEIRERSEE